MEIKIPIYKPSLTGNEKKYVVDCIDSTWISSKGQYISRFEKEFGNYVGVKHSTTVANGTVALHLAMLVLGISEGDEVIVPTFTYIASVNSITYTGGKPVFVDSLPDTWQMDPADVVRKITNKTKAVLAVHLYGHPCDIISLRNICDEHGLFLIEDCAEGLGSKFEGRHVGTLCDISTFSFFGNKTITTGEGGMVSTNDTTLFDRAVHFKGQGLAKHRQYWHDVIGYNFRMTNICAAIGLAQLEQIETFISRKRKIAEYYKKAFEHTVLDFHGEHGNIVHSYWMCSLLVPHPEQRDKLRNHLESNGIETRPLFFPVHTMPMYASKYQKHSVSENIAWRGINLPSFPELTMNELDTIIACVKDFLKQELL